MGGSVGSELLLLERSDELARIAATEAAIRVLRSRGAELERDFAFGVVRQVFQPALAESSTLERADLLQAAAGTAAGLLGLHGAPAAEDAAPFRWVWCMR